MKFVLLSDVHLLYDNPIARKDIARETQLEKILFVLKYASSIKAVILQAGDMFDKPRSWRVLSSIIPILTDYKVPIYSVFGQHDMYLYSEENKNATSLGVLASTGYVKLLDHYVYSFYEAEKATTINIYGCSYGQEVPVPSAKKSRGKRNILVIHRPILLKKEWATQEGHDVLPEEWM